MEEVGEDEGETFGCRAVEYSGRKKGWLECAGWRRADNVLVVGDVVGWLCTYRVTVEKPQFRRVAMVEGQGTYFARRESRCSGLLGGWVFDHIWRALGQ